MKNQHTNFLTGLLLLISVAAGSACSFSSITAQKPQRSETVSTQPTPSPTPGYKPFKKINRDVLDSDKKKETDKSKTKK